MIERLKKILEEKDMTAAQFADLVGVQRSSVSHILSGRNKPGLEFIQKILTTFPDIDPGWFILGRKNETNDLHEKVKVKNEEDKDIDITTPEPENHPALSGKSPAERIIVLYKDGIFKEYRAE